MSKDTETELSRRDFKKLLGVSGAAILGSVSLAGCAGQGGTSYACPYGDQTFDSESALKDHLVAEHAEQLRADLGVGEGAIPCPYGDQEFESLGELRSHIKAEHQDDVSLPGEWDEEVEVAVVGSGFAGLAAAIEAKEAGSNVKIYEKMPRMGGNSRINGGWLGVVGSDKQKEQGVEDSVDRFMDDLLAAGRDLNYPELVRFLGESTRATYRWTVDHLGVEYQDQLHQLGGHSVFRTLKTKEGSGWGIVRKEMEKVEELGVETETQAKLEELVKNEAGEVLGMKIRAEYEEGDEESGEVKYVRATSGVVMATGGFGANVDMRTAQWPSLGENMGTTNQSGTTGEALQEAIDKGATPVQMSWIQLGPWTCPEEKGFGQGSNWTIGTAPFGIWIDSETGKRFVNEVADRRTRAKAQLAVGSDPEYPLLINDAKTIQKAADGLTEELVESGVVYEFDSLDAMASKFGIPVDGLKEQVATYNTAVKEGKDEQFGKPIPEDATQLGNAPWYAMRLWPKVHHTMGGVAINTDAQVLSGEDEPIPNLYAAGEVSGGVHGGSRLGSIAIPDCLSYGRVAGANAAGASNPYK